jgi:hypothetical protein
MVTDIAKSGIRSVKDGILQRGITQKYNVAVDEPTAYVKSHVAMQDREYEKEEALRSLAKNHRRTFSGTPSCDEFTGVARSDIDALNRSTWRTAERHPPFTIARAGRDGDAVVSGTGVDSDVVLMTPIQQLWKSLLIYDNSTINRYGTMRPTA